MIKKGDAHMKKLLILILTLALLLPCLVSCAELINTETQEVEATVADIYHRGAWVQMVPTSKSIIPISHPARYEVTFKYENVTLTINDKELYDYYKDKVGSTVKCDLIIEYYDDGSISRTLKRKENNK
jgi:hypothetical protein